LTAAGLVERTANALGTMRSLERYQGHFYNWYDTRSLAPLPPLYVSSVDSGNLACHLLTLRAGLLALADASILAPRCFEGLRDTAMLLRDPAIEADLESVCAAPPADAAAARAVLERIAARALRIVANPWAQSLARQCQAAIDELAFFSAGKFPTLRELAALDDETGRRARERIEALQDLARQAG